ncbi:MAG: DUF6485 family protein [Candidatus Gastranaerophilales bacterium]|nr:DUF6485 family protein [Candidatus Gastranaerophilales bacterium]
MECKISQNKAHCTCSYPCQRRGLCCECVAYHRSAGQIPGCFFTPAGEKTYDRSYKAFIRDCENR